MKRKKEEKDNEKKVTKKWGFLTNLLSDFTNLNLPEKKLSNKTLQVKRKNSLPTQNS